MVELKEMVMSGLCITLPAYVDASLYQCVCTDTHISMSLSPIRSVVIYYPLLKAKKETENCIFVSQIQVTHSQDKVLVSVVSILSVSCDFSYFK